MAAAGLQAIPNPSAFFLKERPAEEAGSVVISTIKGTRPLLAEIQALVSPTLFAGNPRRMTIGLDHFRTCHAPGRHREESRLQLRRARTSTSTWPAAWPSRSRRPTWASSWPSSPPSRTRPFPGRSCVFGEIGLSGEVRSVAEPLARIKEALSLGFETVLLPAGQPGHAGEGGPAPGRGFWASRTSGKRCRSYFMPRFIKDGFMGIHIFRFLHHRSASPPPAISSPSSACRGRRGAAVAFVLGVIIMYLETRIRQDPVQDHLELDHRAPTPASSWAGRWGRSTRTSPRTPPRPLHPHLLPHHHALHRVPRRHAEVGVAGPGPPLPLLQGEERRPELQDPGHERHHRRPDHRPLRHGVHRGHPGHPPVRPQGAAAHRRFRRTG